MPSLSSDQNTNLNVAASNDPNVASGRFIHEQNMLNHNLWKLAAARNQTCGPPVWHISALTTKLKKKGTQLAVKSPIQPNPICDGVPALLDKTQRPNN